MSKSKMLVDTVSKLVMRKFRLFPILLIISPRFSTLFFLILYKLQLDLVNHNFHMVYIRPTVQLMRNRLRLQH